MFMSLNARAMGLDLRAEETIEAAAAAGFGGVDLLVRDIVDSKSDPKELRSRIDTLGLKPGAWPLPMNWRGDSDSFQRDLEQLPRYADCAAVLGLKRTGTWILPETIGSATVEETAEWHNERLGAIARVLDDFGIELGLEVIGVESFRTGRGLPFVHRLETLNEYLKPLLEESPNVGILLDGFHLYAAGEAIEAGFAWGVKKIVWVHLAGPPNGFSNDLARIEDSTRGLPGKTPDLRDEALLTQLFNEGYEGPVTAEPLSRCTSLAGLTPLKAVNRVAEALRSVWPNPLNSNRQARA